MWGEISLDPASCAEANSKVQAQVYYTKSDNGLIQTWNVGKRRVWMNPPYGKTAGKSNQGIWTARLIRAYLTGEIDEGLALVNATPGEKWFKPLLHFPILFVGERIAFHIPGGKVMDSPTHNNAIIYCGRNLPAFCQHFQPFGVIMQAIAGLTPIPDFQPTIVQEALL